MNIDPTRPGNHSPDEEPVMIGAGLRPVEDRLRRALDADARSITPTDRLGAILKEAHVVESRTTWSHRWFAPAAAAAAAVLVAGTVWAVTRPPATTPPVAGTSAVNTSQETTGTPTTGSSSVPSSSVPTQTATRPTTGSTTAPVPATWDDVPVYWIGETKADFRLFREFRTVPRVDDQITSAVAAMTRLQPLDPDYSTPWRPATTVKATRSGSAVTVDLSADAFANTQVGSELASRAVQQLVYTATAAAATAGTPVSTVTILVDGKAYDAWGAVALGKPMTRAPQLEVQSHAWVTSPLEKQELSAGSIEFTGYGTSFEANFPWKVTKPDGTVVASGSAMGGSGTGVFGEVRFSATLVPGSYVVTLSTDDPSGGTEGKGPAVDTKSFTVR